MEWCCKPRSTTPFVVVVCVLVTQGMLTTAADFYLEATLANGHLAVSKRDNATSGSAIQLKSRDSLHITFCLRQQTSVQVRGVLYSNDGDGDQVGLVLDQTFLGTFNSSKQTNWGQLWDVFLRSPPFFPIAELAPGRHSLRLMVLGSSDGIEVSAVHLRLSDERLTRDILTCSLFCHSSLPTAPTVAGSFVPAYIKQASYMTTCAEEDNVKVPLYAHGVSEYTITATMPSYPSSGNHRDPNTTGCAFLTPLLWAFKNVPLLPTAPTRQQSAMAHLLVSSVNGNGSISKLTTMIRVEFKLRGKSDGFVDANMGSTLRITFQKMSGTVTVRPSYTGKSQTTTTLPQRSVAPGENFVTVDFQDFTWREGSDNVILLEFGDIATNSLTLVDLQLERRPMTGEKVQTVHKSDKMIMDAIDVDFWWREPESMRVANGESGQMWDGVDYFRVSLPVPWNGGFAQVFVMYQDGNARLLPLAPPGVDWIPFGSSVLIGQSDPTQLRPAAPISMVTFHPSSLRFNISYRDGGSAVVKLSVGMAHTEVTVYEVKDGRPDPSRPRPFATLRSMYLEDGNSDCDSVLVNGDKYFPILGSWEEVAGNSFFFFRRCESKHLTLSPDVRIDVKRTDLSAKGF